MVHYYNDTRQILWYILNEEKIKKCLYIQTNNETASLKITILTEDNKNRTIFDQVWGEVGPGARPWTEGWSDGVGEGTDEVWDGGRIGVVG